MDQNHSFQNNDEVSLRDILSSISLYIKFIFSKWIVLVISIFFGAFFGYLYTLNDIPIYTATATFVVDNGVSSTPSKLQGLPQMLGGQAISSSGGGLLDLFSSTNYSALYKSKRILEKALLSKMEVNSSSILLIDHFFNIKKNQTDSYNINKKNVDFRIDKVYFTSSHNSVMNVVLEETEKMITVQISDVGLPVLSISVSSPDSLFSKVFNDHILDAVNMFYIEVKNQKALENINRLEVNADSLKNVLFDKMNILASEQERIPNANTAYQSFKLPSQKVQLEVSYLQSLYTTTASELVIARNEIRKIPPFLIVLDQPTFPLPVSEPNIVLGVLLGSISFLIISVLILVLFYLVKGLLNEN
jgi:hypothetical protein